MRPPLTVRQAQKLLSARKLHWDDRNMLAGLLGMSSTDHAPFEAALSRLAQRHGSNYIILDSSEGESTREHKIGTDEVAPQSDTPSDESDVHGGDSASGEVEDGLSHGGDNESGDGSEASGQGDSATGTGSGGSGKSGLGDRTEGASSPQTPRSSDAGQASDSRAETGSDSTPADDADDTSSNAGGSNGLRADGQPQRKPDAGKSEQSAEAKTAGGHKGHKVRRSSQGTDEASTDAGINSSDSGSEEESLTGRANSPAKKSESGGDNISREALDEADTENERRSSPAKQSGDAGDEASEIYRYRSVKKSGGGASPSTAAKKSHGGVTAEMSRAGITPGLVKKARVALARLIEGGLSQSGPRWDWVEFSKRLKTHRPLQPARREEEGRPAILVLADVSGSCAGFSDKSLLAAQAVGRLGIAGADVIVISHSNGYPFEWQVNGQKPEPVHLEGKTPEQPWYEENLRRFNIEAVVALGDWDAEWLYHWLAEMPQMRRLVWLDNFSCNNVPPTVRRDLFQRASNNEADHWSNPWQFGEPWSRAAKQKSTYVIGCKDADSFITGLRLGIGG